MTKGRREARIDEFLNLSLSTTVQTIKPTLFQIAYFIAYLQMIYSGHIDSIP